MQRPTTIQSKFVLGHSRTLLSRGIPGRLIEPEARGKLAGCWNRNYLLYRSHRTGESGLHLYESLLMEEAARLNKKVQLYFPLLRQQPDHDGNDMSPT